MPGLGFVGSAFLPYDDEFDAGNIDWTVTDTTGLGHTVDFGVTTPGRVHMQSGTVIHRARIPPIPFTVTAYLASVVMDNIDTTPGNASLAIGQASPAGSPGPIFWGPEMPDVDNLHDTALYDGRFGNFGATPTHLGTKIEAAGHVYDVPTWQRIVVHSATNMDLLYSHDGSSYTTYGTGFNPTLTAGAVLLVSFACTCEWEWLRFTQP